MQTRDFLYGAFVPGKEDKYMAKKDVHEQNQILQRAKKAVGAEQPKQEQI